MSAPRRASSVDTCSVDGCARSSSDHCTMRPGVGSTRTTTRSMAARGRMRFQIEQDERAQRLRIAHRRGQLQRARVRLARGEVQLGVQHRGAAIGAFETHGQRLEHAAQHERQRLQAFDRPFELERRVERLVVDERHERRQVLAARGVLPPRTERPEARRQLGGRQRRKLSQRADAPAAQHVERLVRAQRAASSARRLPRLICTWPRTRRRVCGP